MRYAVETEFTYGWENCWTEDGDETKPATFSTRDEAQAEIDDVRWSYNLRDLTAPAMRIAELEEV